MRSHAILLATLLALSAGCLSEDDAPAATPEASAPAANATMALPPLHFEGDVPVGADPFNVVPVVTPVGGGVPCSTSASACFMHDFTVPAGTNVSVALEATLAWSLPANDFDLYLYEGEEQLSQDGINGIPPAAGAPPTDQVMHHDGLGPGDYTFWVVAWNSVQDGYTLDVAFS